MQMAVSYNRLWKLLIDKKMTKASLRKEAGIAPNTMTKLSRDEAVALVVLEKICAVLDADFGDIMEYAYRLNSATTPKSRICPIYRTRNVIY